MEERRKFKRVEFEKLERCPYCSSGDIHLHLTSPDRLSGTGIVFSLFLCRRCGLAFQNPRVKESYIDIFYTDKIGYFRPPEITFSDKIIFNKMTSSPPLAAGYPVNRQGKNIYTSGGAFSALAIKDFFTKQTLVNHFYYCIQKRNLFWFLLTWPLKRVLRIKGFPFFKKNGKLLEIGCSNGEFLQKLNNLGWNVKGVEMGRDVAIYAKKERGLDVENKKVEECHFARQQFDVIIMRMVLEHLYSPFSALKTITQWLRQGGQLIFSVPYFNGFEFKWFKSYSYGLQLPTHVTFFNKKVLNQYLTAMGYLNIKFYHHFFARDIIASAQYKYKDTGSRFYKVLGYNKQLRPLIKIFVFLLSLFNKTSRITVYAQKRK